MTSIKPKATQQKYLYQKNHKKSWIVIAALVGPPNTVSAANYGTPVVSLVSFPRPNKIKGPPY